ncbi:aminotransferase class V-fold PLP-dependent enzyme [Labedella populi]|uniref:Aminotransferase class V-fold PLP-dependent enzyme n=2 Tax=Labedella populi TaxID=2498850 RepID=A0A444QDL6_9MICO|nr:aminotransferase class V-fold PLP-dependent enzyme [Labedella populi]
MIPSAASGSTGAGGASEAFIAGFTEDPGYLDYAKVGPLSATVRAEANAALDVLSRFRFGAFDSLAGAGERARAGLSAVSGFRPDQFVAQPATSHGLLQVMFGLSGTLLVSPAEFPSLPVAARRAADAMATMTPRWLHTADGRVTPDVVAAHLDDDVSAVAVSLVDPRTGYVADLEGIRSVIGDRLLIVDCIQGFGVVDAPFDVADVIAGGGQKWLRAGWGTGYLALGDRARELITPVLSGFTGTGAREPWDDVPEPADDVSAFSVSNPDLVALARLSASLEEVVATGVPVIASAIAERAASVIDMADEFAITVHSPRAEHERAGLVVLEPDADRLGVLTASLHNHGVTTTTRQGRVRVSVHAGTTAETLGMLRDALISYSTLPV